MPGNGIPQMPLTDTMSSPAGSTFTASTEQVDTLLPQSIEAPNGMQGPISLLQKTLICGQITNGTPKQNAQNNPSVSNIL
eukprot:4597883-Ditylum_brightwellii.AAC.1